jgi:hypothetical protein
VSEESPHYDATGGRAPAPALANAELQATIEALSAFPYRPAAEWVAKVQGSPTEVIAGAILTWEYRSGSSIGSGDLLAPRREAAQAILQARLAEQALNATTQLRNTIDSYQRRSERQTTAIVWLTWVIAVLTAVGALIALLPARH